MKKQLIIALIVVAALIVVSVAKDLVIKVSVEKGVEIVTGLRLSMHGFRVGLIRTLIDIRNLKLFNPPGYKDRTMLDMPEIYVDYDLAAIMGGRVHLSEVRVNLKEFTVVKNEKGELNLDSLKVVQAQKEGLPPQEKAKMPEIQIDSLELGIGKVIYKDYSRPGSPSITEFDINLHEKYSNITNPYSVVSLIVVKALANTTIARLAGFDLQGLQGTIGDTLGSAQKMASEAVAKTHQNVKQVVGATKKTGDAAVKQAKEVTRQATDAAKDIFKNPFGE